MFFSFATSFNVLKVFVLEEQLLNGQIRLADDYLCTADFETKKITQILVGGALFGMMLLMINQQLDEKRNHPIIEYNIRNE